VLLFFEFGFGRRVNAQLTPAISQTLFELFAVVVEISLIWLRPAKRGPRQLLLVPAPLMIVVRLW